MVIARIRTRKKLTWPEKILLAVTPLAALMAALAVYAALSGDTRETRVYAQVLQIKDRTHQLFEGAGSYAGYTMAQAVNAHVFDGLTVGGRTVVKHAYDGAVMLDMAQEGTVFTIAFDGIPRDACPALASAFVRDPDFVQVYVSATGTQGAVPHIGPAATRDQLEAACRDAQARITWWFR